MFTNFSEWVFVISKLDFRTKRVLIKKKRSLLTRYNPLMKLFSYRSKLPCENENVVTYLHQTIDHYDLGFSVTPL